MTLGIVAEALSAGAGAAEAAASDAGVLAVEAAGAEPPRAARLAHITNTSIADKMVVIFLLIKILLHNNK